MQDERELLYSFPKAPLLLCGAFNWEDKAGLEGDVSDCPSHPHASTAKREHLSKQVMGFFRKQKNPSAHASVLGKKIGAVSLKLFLWLVWAAFPQQIIPDLTALGSIRGGHIFTQLNYLNNSFKVWNKNILSFKAAVNTFFFILFVQFFFLSQ